MNNNNNNTTGGSSGARVTCVNDDVWARCSDGSAPAEVIEGICPEGGGYQIYSCGDGNGMKKCNNKELLCNAHKTEGPICGNGIQEKDEDCDDGNKVDDDECDNKCIANSSRGICGDGIVKKPEQCDDGNTINGDGCESDCTV